MTMAPVPVTLHGSCHCGQLRVVFSTCQDPAIFIPRACDCSFCQKHGASYISDPGGSLSVSASPGGLREYRQGSNTAAFLVCGQCGVLAAVTFEHRSRIYGSLNIGCLDGTTGLRNSSPASLQALTKDEKISRWLQLWVPEVRIFTSGA